MSKTFLIENGQEIPVGSSRGIYTEREVKTMMASNVTTSTAGTWYNRVFDPNTLIGENWLNGSGNFVAPVKGKYRITLLMKTTNGGFSRQILAFNKNSSTLSSGSADPSVVLIDVAEDALGSFSLSGTLDAQAGDIFRFWVYFYSAFSGQFNILVEQILEQVPYIVADNSALISSPAQGDISLRQDGTAFVNDDYSFTEQPTNKRWVGGQIIYKQTFDRGAWNFDTNWTDTGIDLPAGSLILNSEVRAQSTAFGGQILNKNNAEFRADASGNVWSWSPAAHTCSSWWPTLYYIKT